jgi:hypothetical protein
VPERVGQRRALDVLDHVRDVAAESDGVQVRAPNDVPAHAAREAGLVVVPQTAGLGALVPHEVCVVALGVDDEAAHLALVVGRVEVDELGGERVLRGRGLGGSRGPRDEDPRVHALLGQHEPAGLLGRGPVLLVGLPHDELRPFGVEGIRRKGPVPESLRLATPWTSAKFARAQARMAPTKGSGKTSSP